MIPDRGYRFEWFINETEVEKIETENEQMIHKLKILPQYFEDKLKGIKNWEIRNNDRPFKVDDILQLEEWSDETGYTGRLLQEYIKKIYMEAIRATRNHTRQAVHWISQVMIYHFKEGKR